MNEEKRKKLKQSLVYLLRDIAIAFLIVAIVMAGIFAYTQVWPPMVVVESSSMQHSQRESFIGVVDTGDLVLVQRAPTEREVTTYVEGRAEGYSTYSDYGDVIIFKRLGSETDTPIIHRAIMWMQWNSSNGSFDIPSLKGLEMGVDWTASKNEPFDLGQGDWIRLINVGFKHVNVTFSMSDFMRYKYSGYATMGDNNVGGHGYDGWLVREEWVIGKARGELPWFGLIKLTLLPQNGCCPRGWGDPSAPSNSWTSLTISLILIIAGPILFDIGTSYLAKRREKRKEAKAEESSASGEISEIPSEKTEEVTAPISEEEVVLDKELQPNEGEKKEPAEPSEEGSEEKKKEEEYSH